MVMKMIFFILNIKSLMATELTGLFIDLLLVCEQIKVQSIHGLAICYLVVICCFFSTVSGVKEKNKCIYY